MKQAQAESFVQVSDFVVFSMVVFDGSPIESADELDASDGALSGARPTYLFAEDGVVEYAKVLDLGEFVEGVEALPVIDQVVLHREHVKVLEPCLVVNLTDAVLVQSEALQVFEMAEFNHLIPRGDVVTFEVDELE